MVDVEDVNIIVDGDQEFEDEDGSDRNLNRKTDNMADYDDDMETKLKNLQIIDDQNLDMMDDDGQEQEEEYPDEDQHYPDEDEDEELEEQH